MSADGVGVILLYHRLAEVPEDPFDLVVAPTVFEAQLKAVTELGPIRPLQELAQDAEAGALEGISFAITFDDGYADNLQFALPILERCGAFATVFVISEYVGGNQFWWDELTELFHAREGDVDSQEFHDVWAQCQLLSEAERRSTISSMRQRVAAGSGNFGRSLSHEELRALGSHPLIEVGAHTKTHPVLASLDVMSQTQEITGSKAALESLLGQSVHAFSYPYGGPTHYTQSAVDSVREAGFKVGCAATVGTVTAASDRFQLPRLAVPNWPAERLGTRLRQLVGSSFATTQSSDSTRTIVDLGDLRRLAPISDHWGFDRGKPIDRYYIERFLATCSDLVRGRVLEIGEPLYAPLFGGDRVDALEILDVDGGTHATYTCALQDGSEVPSDAFDCAIVTQTLHLIYEAPEAMQTLWRVLKPGGALLATIPGITRTSSEEWADSWFWGFTPASVRRLAGDVFGPENVDVQSFGNVLAATAFLYGLAAEELTEPELESEGADFPVTVALVAIK